MAKINLSGMTVEALMDLRERVDGLLSERRAELERQLEGMGVVGSRRIVRGGGSALKGRKVPPKYRSPSGDTWAGRGASPRWLVAAIKGGKKLGRFPDRQVSTQGTEKAQVEAVILGHHGTDCPNSTWRYYRWLHHCVNGDSLLCVE